MRNLLRNRTIAARDLFAAGFDYEQIGERLGLSPVTVRKYLDEDFRQEIESKDKARRDLAKAERAAEKAAKEEALRREFIAEANAACCMIPPGDFDLVFGLWKERRKKRGQ